MLLEAVPNLSLGPGSPALDAVRGRLDAEASPGWAHLDTHTDPDHNRTVLTLAGAPSPITRVLARLVDALLEHGSLVGHEGVHPRIGLLDVLPLVRLDQARDRDARRVARQAAQHLARDEIPVMYYGDLATRPERGALAWFRKRVRFTGEPDPLEVPPDAGPSRLHPTMGAACVGVRDPLVAYNVLLDTTDRDLGERIARGLRPANGGLPGVQALAFPLPSKDDRVQVSTNITDTHQATPADVFGAVTEQARRAGVEVIGGELVGLAPKRCLPEDPSRMGLDERPISLEAHLDREGLPDHVP